MANIWSAIIWKYDDPVHWQIHKSSDCHMLMRYDVHIHKLEFVPKIILLMLDTQDAIDIDQYSRSAHTPE